MGSLGPAERAGPYGHTILLPAAQPADSPRDSPPIAKKRVCRVDGGKVGQISAMRSASALPKHFTFENQQILPITTGGEGKGNFYTPRASAVVKHDLRTSGLFARPEGVVLAAAPTRRVPCPVSVTTSRLAAPRLGRNAEKKRRNVHFSPQVMAYYMDEDGPICTECRVLNAEPRDRQAFLTRNMNRAYLRRISGPVYEQETAPGTAPEPRNIVTVRMPPSPPSESGYPLTTGPAAPEVLKYGAPSRAAGRDEHPAVRAPSPNFTFIDDPADGVRLKFVLPLGVDYSPNDVIVKANMSGNRIRVIANKVTQQSGGCHVTEQFNERYQVPAQVNPYRVSARLDIKGNLTVEAPLLGPDKRTGGGQLL